MRSFLAAIAFYTVIPLPKKLTLHFDRVARWLPLVGLVIGILLAGMDALLAWVVPPAMQSLLVVCLWLGITGGLHLDGAMDTADGLAAGNGPIGDHGSIQGTQRRLQAMVDSSAGAFGVMVAIALILLKFVAAMHLPEPRWVWWLLVPVWGRWAQLAAISFYPYLKREGKGRFLKDTTCPVDLAIASGGVLVMMLALRLAVHSMVLFPVWGLGCVAISLGIGWWFNRQLGGQTGDTYGATVEWTEALSLAIATVQIPGLPGLGG
ncbi:MAG: adenosylcobinamide-GDP ribazoletransferase [Cyanobacteria bacterium P01_E01_bin.34]